MPTASWLTPEALIDSAQIFLRALARPGIAEKVRVRLQRAKLATWFVILGRWDELEHWVADSAGRRWPLPPTKKAAYDEFVQHANATAYAQGMRTLYSRHGTRGVFAMSSNGGFLCEV